LDPTDLELLYEWENDTTIWMVSGTQTPFSRFVLEQYLTSSHQDIYTNKQLRLIIEFFEDTEDDIGYPVGCIDLFDFDPKNMHAGIGILIGDKEMMNHGFATEALGLLINYCFKTVNLHQIYCNITTENEASLHLFKKMGFEITGLKQDWIYHDGKFHDEYILQLINK
jgi:diamine N-acetyltransferase